MPKKAINTTVELELNDGSSVPLTLTYSSLYKLSAADKAAYKAYNEAYTALQKGTVDEIALVRLLYTGYLCANITEGTSEGALGFDDFIDKLPADHETVGNMAMALMFPKRVGATATPSK